MVAKCNLHSTSIIYLLFFQLILTLFLVQLYRFKKMKEDPAGDKD